MAYAALTSLRQIVKGLLNSSQISVLSPSWKIIESIDKAVIFLQEVLERSEESSSSERLNSLKEEIREAAYTLQDALESHVSNHFPAQSKSCEDEGHKRKRSPVLDEAKQKINSFILSPDLDEAQQKINSFIERVKKMEDERSKQDQERSTPLAVPSIIYSGEKKSKMVGLSDEFGKIRDLLLTDWWPNRKTVSLLGMAGIGKTKLAKQVYEDSLVKDHFDLCVWVTVGPNCHVEEVLHSILYQLNSRAGLLTKFSDLVSNLHKSLEGKRYLLVLDDVWHPTLWFVLQRFLQEEYNGSRVLLTTRDKVVAQHADEYEDPHQIRFLDEEESWDLLRENVFGGMPCPSHQLEIAGKKIAKNCEGLPLAIITVAYLLKSSKDKMTEKYWEEAAEKKNSLFTDAHEKISEVLFSSYKNLPQHLKACFLYMGVFPPSSKIPASKIIQLWIAEGFVEAKLFKTIDDFALECLAELVSRSIVLVRQPSSIVGVKTCSLHSAFLHLCVREALKENLFHILNSSTETLERERRLCVQNNILLGIKEVQNRMTSISRVHSLLCTGPHHIFPVPISSGLDLGLLRVLDALTIRLYKFPDEVLKLVQLRYLALTYNGKLPASISKLWKLQYLIVCRHLNVKYPSDAESYLPMEIWDMKELKHLQFMGSNIPDPCSALLPNLLTLSDVSAQSCTKGILRRIPNLKKFGVQIEIRPDAAETLSCFNHLFHLGRLESFKCVIVNPKPKSQIVVTPVSIANFPPSLKKLTLSGLGFPWKDMRIIAQMPNLEVLKLRCYAFQGPTWVSYEWDFERLRYLLIEDTDLECWEADGICFRSLEHLIISNCYKLKEISWVVEEMYSLKTLELVDCPSAVDSVKQDQGYIFPQVCVRFSWEEEKLRR